MVTLHRSLPASVNLKPKLPILGLFQNHHQPPLPKLPSTVFPGLSMTSSPQPQDPIMLFPPANQVHAYCFDGYWEDMRSIKAFLHRLTQTLSFGISFYDKDSPLYTLPRHLPPSLITDAVITDSVIGDGCILNRCNIKGTVVGLQTRVGDGAIIEDSILMGSDAYQMQDVQAKGIEGKDMDILIGIGEGSHVRKAIVDKNARIGKNVMIINKDNIQEANMEAYGYTIKAGIVVILRGAVIPNGSIL